MANFSRTELNVALKKLLGLRGSIALGFDETVSPVVVVGAIDSIPVGARLALPWRAYGFVAAVVASRSYVIIVNPTDSNVVLNIEGVSVEFAGYFHWVIGTISSPGRPTLGSSNTLGGQTESMEVPGVGLGGATIEYGDDPVGTWQQGGSHFGAAGRMELLHLPRDGWPLFPGKWCGIRGGGDNIAIGAANFWGTAWPIAR